MGEFVKVIGQDIWIHISCKEALLDTEQWVLRFYDDGALSTKYYPNHLEIEGEGTYRIHYPYKKPNRMASQIGSILSRYSTKSLKARETK